MGAIPLKTMVAAIKTQATIPNVTTYLRQPAPAPPTINADDLRVKPYLVIHPSPGGPSEDARLGGEVVGKNFSFQLTCAVGDETALEVLIDAVTSRFDEWHPVLPSPYDVLPIGRFRLLNDVGPSRRDQDIKPPRFWVPLIYGNTLNN